VEQEDASSRTFSSLARSAVLALPYWLGFVALYAAFYASTNFLAYSELTISPWNPETGLAAAVAARHGWRSMWWIFLAFLTSRLLTGLPRDLAPELTAAAVYALTYTAYFSIMSSRLLWRTENRTRMVTFLLVTSATAAITSAALRVVVASVTSYARFDYLLPPIITLTVGDLIGTLTLAPALLLWPGLGAIRDEVRRHWPGYGLLIAAQAVIITGVFGVDLIDQFKFFYLLFLPVITFAIWRGLFPAMAALVVTDIAVMAIIYLRDFTVSTATELQILMVTLAATTLYLGAAVDERRRLEVRLRQTNEQLQDSQSALHKATRLSMVSEMTATLAHELNQPLTAARGFVRAAKRRIAMTGSRKADVAKLIDQSVVQIDGASKLIEETRAYLRRNERPMSPTDMAAIIRISLLLLEPELKGGRTHVRFNEPASTVMVQGNKTQLQQVVMNLVRNSVDALVGRLDGWVDVSITRSPEEGIARVSVKDNGPGIPPDRRRRLFMPLDSRKPEGLGLGLSLCRSIVSAHHGKIWLDEDSPHTTFMFSIPLAGRART
jgi:signal transduction histidine kinase